jgi:hypothetical protein
MLENPVLGPLEEVGSSNGPRNGFFRIKIITSKRHIKKQVPEIVMDEQDNEPALVTDSERSTAAEHALNCSL